MPYNPLRGKNTQGEGKKERKTREDGEIRRAGGSEGTITSQELLLLITGWLTLLLYIST